MKRISLILLILIGVLFVGGCGNDSQSKGGKYLLYYTNKDGTALVTVEYEPEAEDTYDMIEEFIDQISKNTDDTDILKSVPDDVEVTEYRLDEDSLYLTFNENYNEMDNCTEVICRAALVRTLTQLDEVSYVTFIIVDTPLTTTDGETVGSMTSSDFVDSIGNTSDEETLTTFTLYFANETGDGLLAYTYEDSYSSDGSMEEYIVEQLIKGPTEEGYYRTLSDRTELISVTTNEGICYVNFGGNFLTETTNVQDNIVIYSIVNSISEISYVNSVQISVNGETNVLYHANISLETLFTRNMDYVISEEEEES